MHSNLLYFACLKSDHDAQKSPPKVPTDIKNSLKCRKKIKQPVENRTLCNLNNTKFKMYANLSDCGTQVA